MPELIDKQAALKKMCETCGDCERFEKAMRSTHPDFVTDKCNNYKFLAEQPTIEAEPVRRGRWIDKGEYAVCTECGGRSGTQYDGVQPVALLTKFCPHCGAKMMADEPDSGSELKPCPFCDGRASYTDNFYGNGTGHCVFCEDCGAGTAILTGATPPEELKAMSYRDWNRRANNES